MIDLIHLYRAQFKTTIAEQFDPQGFAVFINRFLTPMTDVILAHGGTFVVRGGALTVLEGVSIAIPVYYATGSRRKAIGATLIFLVARSSFGESLAARAGPWIGKLRDGFKENALSYLLFLRLVPAFPFFVVNLAPALLGVPLATYVLGTFLGIIPATTAFSIAGSGLGSVVEAQNAAYNACVARTAGGGDAGCPYSIDTSKLVTTELILAFAALGVVALIPIALKKWNSRHVAA